MTVVSSSFIRVHHAYACTESPSIGFQGSCAITGALLTAFGMIGVEAGTISSSSSNTTWVTFKVSTYFVFQKMVGLSVFSSNIPSPPIPGSVGSSVGAGKLQKAANCWYYSSLVTGAVPQCFQLSSAFEVLSELLQIATMHVLIISVARRWIKPLSLHDLRDHSFDFF